jgi:hypothetical protein
MPKQIICLIPGDLINWVNFRIFQLTCLQVRGILLDFNFQNMKRFLMFLPLLVLINSPDFFAQNRGTNRDNYRINIYESFGEIKIDGILDEEVWLSAETAGNLQRVTPVDTGMAIAQTTVMMTYNSTALYLGVVCYDPLPGKRPVESLRHDFNFNRNDNFLIFFDTYNDQTNGFTFGVTAAGAQWDGLLYDGGTENFNWDIKWRSAVKSYDDRWVIEIAIPFRSLRYHGGTSEWGFNFSRFDLKSSEKSSWAPMPRQFSTANLAYTGTLVWDKPLPSSGLRFSLTPHVSGMALQNFEAVEKLRVTNAIGMDARVMLSTSLNLDLTLNPDYSQVENDRQQFNLDRFELFYPEKRQFFIENSDLFANLGANNLRPFFSRRIGLNNPVNGGVRFSGQLGDIWRINMMDIQTGSGENIPAANFMVAALQRQVFSRSSITAFIVNKQVTNIPEDLSPAAGRYNRVAGLEYNLASNDNRWRGKAFYHKSFYTGAAARDDAMAVSLGYSSRSLAATLFQSNVGSGYHAETGYIRRRGYYQINPAVQYRFFPASSPVAFHGPGVSVDMYLDTSLTLSDKEAQLQYSVEWLNKATLSFDVRDSYIRLLSPFDPTNTGGVRLGANEEFNWNESGFTFRSDTRKLFHYRIGSRYGGYFNGKRWSLNGEVNYRIQPYATFTVSTTYTDISLPFPYNSAGLLLVSPKVSVTFTKTLFLSSFIQFNNQNDNLNMNMRFQWRFAPVSDLFIVYTENSFPADYRVKDRGLAVKLSYWFN